MPRVAFREAWTLGRVLANGQLLRYGRGDKGYTVRFERALAQKIDSRHVLAVTSGTNALITALAAAGVGPGDEVLVPAYTWVSTALAPLAVGAVPILVNIDESLAIDPADIERKITPHTRAIMPVHMLNLPCDMDRIMGVARRHGLLVVEDACQAVGVPYRGRKLGTIGDLGAFSFNHYKNITSGEGGAVLTDDDRYFTRARMYHDPGNFIRGHAETDEPLFSAMNFRVSELTGAVLYAQLQRLDPLLARLRRRYELVAETFEGAAGCRVSPHNDPDNAMGLTVLFDDPEEARRFGATRGVERLLDTDRHVFTNWDAILSKRSFHPKMNAYNWANRDIEYRIEDYRHTLDILSRTCRVALGTQYPASVMRLRKPALRRAVRRPAGPAAAAPAE
ncbi:DegT/DnrJ/EryC1/StrS family aminotransferase [Psychromarinibacter sp. C21-152]|uniref:DegT/DnrJ/EryC1/StrS family aminotransferase n=1 Tax=Psychromarinibacter sediminicola TaxID=3033385 RepID=A0AAE3TAY8_9RHOB|nr:DegT/DnrJ/EryC1/StrS family aminotransferase [Psychromarinibacter sediminicola]MDF0602095.1 DegT/DnrJ/EryC1/StrS family aminotransferase [Psychromarinibacter sediminicola]